MRKAIAAVVALSLAGFAGSAQAVTGQSAIDKLIGNTIIGKVSSRGAELVAFFAKDGTLKSVEGGNRTEGRWSSKNDKLCVVLSGGVEERCFVVVAEGDVITLFGHDMLMAKLLLGNAKGLN